MGLFSGRRVKVVATLGPATRERECIVELLRAGVDVVRLNFSHGTREEHGCFITTVRELASELDKPVAILQDLQGPKLRTGPLRDERPLELKDGEGFTLTTRPVLGEKGLVSANYANLPRDVAPGSRILLDDGRMELQVMEVQGQEVRCRIIKGGLLGGNKGMNLPGVSVSVPTFTPKDREDLEFGLKMGVDYVAMSFVRHPTDVEPLREIMKGYRARVPLLAKIEKPQALHNLEGILGAFDGVMVARGDLGVELSPEEVPVWQKIIIREANEAGKPVIIATQMLESMIDNPRPTRAEASDVANAVLDGTDAVMLSGETSIGSYPLEAVSVMVRIIQQAEATMKFWPTRESRRISRGHAVSHAACSLARDLEVRAVVVLTRRGRTAQLVSKDRPQDRIIALTDDERVARRLALWWGVQPLLMPFPQDAESALRQMEETLLRRKLVARGDDLVVVGSTPLAARGRPNFVKVHRVRGR